MSILNGVLNKLGIRAAAPAARSPLSIFLLDDDTRRHEWFAKRFARDHLDIASDVRSAIRLLSTNVYDAIFLDHDLLPEHYEMDSLEDEQRTGYAVAAWLAAHPDLQPASMILVHTRNADAAMKMVEELRRSGRQAQYLPYPLLIQKIKKGWLR